MEALKNLCKTQNICLICTLHQSSSEVLSMTDYTYVLAKGGQNVFWGPTIELKGFLELYEIITLNTNRVPIETFVRLSAEGLRDIRLVNMEKNIKQMVNTGIKSNENNLVNKTLQNITKKFCYKDIRILIQKEMIEFFKYRYKFYSLDAILTITTSLLLANTFGTDFGQYDDCSLLDQDMDCQQRQLSINMVERNVNYMCITLWIISSIRVTLTIHDKLTKTKYLYHNRQNS